MIIFCQYAATGQKMPSDYFDEAGRFYEKKEFEKALVSYQYIVDHYPKNELYPKSFYNVGYIYYGRNDFEKAIAIFRTILHEKFNENEGQGGSIMGEPYANYRHRASEILSNIYYDQEKFDSALHYLVLADTANPYLHFCGNAIAGNDIHTALRYADIYQKMNQPDKAIKKLLPLVFETLADNSMVIDELKKLLKGTPNLKDKLDEALGKINTRKIRQGENSYNRYYIKFLDAEIEIPMNDEEGNTKFDKQKAVKQIMLTQFYRMIIQ
jgi:tetratricopeptide (TPR) repeat protein